jgi:RNA polymerase sigma factor (sigma-70 family)
MSIELLKQSPKMSEFNSLVDILAPIAEAFLHTDQLPHRRALTPEADHALGVRIASGTAADERDQLIGSLLATTYKAAVDQGIRQDRHHTIEDHFGAGALALVEAVKSYDPGTTKLGITAYAEAAMHQAIAARTPSDTEVLFSDLDTDIADPGAAAALAEVENTDSSNAQKAALQELMEERLTEREREVLEYRSGIRLLLGIGEGDKSKIPTQKQVAAVMGVSKARVHHLEDSGFYKLLHAAPNSKLSNIRY